MKKLERIGFDIEIDKLTNSIENVITGDSFPTDISVLTLADIKNISKKNKWLFDWKFEYKKPEMKNKVKELDVDFIGGQSEPLTENEQLTISAFIKQMKDQRSKKSKRRSTKLEKHTT